LPFGSSYHILLLSSAFGETDEDSFSNTYLEKGQRKKNPAPCFDDLCAKVGLYYECGGRITLGRLARSLNRTHGVRHRSYLYPHKTGIIAGLGAHMVGALFYCKRRQ